MKMEIDEMNVDELVEALQKRCHATIIGAVMPDDNSRTETKVWFSGHHVMSLGLADLVHRAMRSKMKQIE